LPRCCGCKLWDHTELQDVKSVGGVADPDEAKAPKVKDYLRNERQCNDMCNDAEEEFRGLSQEPYREKHRHDPKPNECNEVITPLMPLLPKATMKTGEGEERGGNLRTSHQRTRPICAAIIKNIVPYRSKTARSGFIGFRSAAPTVCPSASTIRCPAGSTRWPSVSR
jgi:hypothetical protein